MKDMDNEIRGLR